MSNGRHVSAPDCINGKVMALSLIVGKDPVPTTVSLCSIDTVWFTLQEEMGLTPRLLSTSPEHTSAESLVNKPPPSVSKPPIPSIDAG